MLRLASGLTAARTRPPSLPEARRAGVGAATRLVL